MNCKTMRLKFQENRMRVERLLQDDFSVEDLSRLIRMLRSSADKKSIIRDIGDLLAHEDIRDSGALFTRGKEMYEAIKFNNDCRLNNGLALDQAPSNLWSLMDTNLRYYKKKDFSKYKFSRSSVLNEIKRLKNVATVNSDGTLNLNIRHLHPMVNLLCFSLAIFPAYDDNDVYQELQKLLIKEGLLFHKETPKFRTVRKKLAQFVVLHLHRTELMFSETRVSYLQAGSNKTEEDKGELISVSCYFQTTGRPNNIGHAQTLFESNLSTNEYVVDGIEWREPIEINNNWKLTNMRSPD